MKKAVQSVLGRFGLALHRVKRPVAGERVGDLGLYRTPIGTYYLPLDAPGDIVIDAMKRGEVFEPEVVEVARRLITPGTVVLDIGANFGQMALIFAGLTGPTGRVFAFEAQARVFEIFLRNIEVNDAKNIEPVFGAVFSESGRLFHFPEPDFSRFAAYGSYNIPLNAKHGPEVTSLRIDDINFEKPVSFMKVDVQGSDLAAMRGAENTIRDHRMPILFEFEQRFQKEFGTTFQDYIDFVRHIDYKIVETIIDINYLAIPSERIDLAS